jgi:putative FmdB family regulatory protein
LPTYEYRCGDCGHQYERREGFDAPARQVCPKCGGESQRVLYAPPILFKASGFYVTDNRKGGLVGASTSSTSSEGGNGDGDKNDFTVEAAKPADIKPAAKKAEKSSEASTAT